MFLKFLFLFVLKLGDRECPHNGVFPVPNTSCKTYKICSDLGAKKYHCPSTSLFDARTQDCVLNFICPDSAICSHAPPGLYADPNYSKSNIYYIECSRNGYGFEVRYEQCGYNEVFVSDARPPHSGSCQSVVEYTTTEVHHSISVSSLPNTTVTLTPITNVSLSDITIIDTTISNVVISTTKATTTVTSIINSTIPDITTPDTTILDATIPDATIPDATIPNATIPNATILNTAITDSPTLTTIVTENSTGTRLPENITESITIDNTTEALKPETTTPSTLPTLTPIPSSDCQKSGVFPVYHSNCKAYMVCQHSGVSFAQFVYRCSSRSFFDPWNSKCVADYKCLESACVNQPQGSLHLDPNDANKNRYYQCAMDNNGVLIPLYLECETGQQFDDEKKVCGNVISSPNSETKNSGILQWVSSKFKWMFGMK